MEKRCLAPGGGCRGKHSTRGDRGGPAGQAAQTEQCTLDVYCCAGCIFFLQSVCYLVSYFSGDGVIESVAVVVMALQTAVVITQHGDGLLLFSLPNSPETVRWIVAKLHCVASFAGVILFQLTLPPPFATLPPPDCAGLCWPAVHVCYVHVSVQF